MPLRYWILLVFVLSAVYANLRGKVRFAWPRALTDFTVLLAPLNAALYLSSRVHPKPYLAAETFPELAPLREQWQMIRDEAMAIRGDGMLKAADGYNDIGFNSFFRTGWTRFYVKWYGDDLPSATQWCPKTAALLASIPTVKAAMFASLPPGGRLVRHRDPYAGSLRYHLGLATPNSPGCYIEVDGERYHWRDGEAILFDETFIHYAENTTDQQRVILFCDVERPLRFWPLGAVNRWFARHVMTLSQTRNVPGDKVGGLNRFFGQAYKVRVAAKAFKAKTRLGYYVTKWALMLGLLAWIFWPG